MPRYKIVVQAALGEKRKQGARVASRCLWDINTDNYASYSFENVSVRRYSSVGWAAGEIPLYRRITCLYTVRLSYV